MKALIRPFLGKIKRYIKKLFSPSYDLEKSAVDSPKPVKHLTGSYVYDELNKILNGQKLNIVDVGGAVNLQPHYNKLIGNANFYVFEPDERSYSDLVNTRDRYSHPNDFHYINKALSGFNGIRTLYLSNVPTGTSILKLKEDQLFFSKNHPYFFPMKELSIQTFTLETVLNELGVNYFDAIKLDVQGAELEIIKGIDENRFKEINVIELEIGLHELYENQTQFCDALAFMKEKGFGLFDLRTNRGSFPNAIDNFSYQEKYFDTHDKSPSVAARLWEFDAIFFREPSWISNNSISKERLLRIVALYCVYNFFAEAIQIVNKVFTEGTLSQDEQTSLTNSIIAWNKKEQTETAEFDKLLKITNYETWGQYMRTQYPSN